MYNRNFYGIDPYMYDDPYTILAKAQEGLEMPFESNYSSYEEFKKAYDNWLNMLDRNAALATDTIPVQTPSSGLLQTPASTVAQAPSRRALTAYQGPSVVDFLTNQGVASDYKTRANIAKALGIPNYSRKDYQNLQMIEMIRQNPDILNMIPATSSKKGRKSTKSLPNSPNADALVIEEDEDGNKIVIDSSGVRTTVDSTGKIINIDSTGTKSDSSKIKLIDTTGKKVIDTSGNLPKPKGGKGDPDEKLAQALLAAVGVLTVGAGLATEAVTTSLDLRDLAKKFSVNPTLLERSFKKMKPKLDGAARAYKNMGLGAQEIYDQLEELIEEDLKAEAKASVSETKKAMKNMGRLSRTNSPEVVAQLNRSSPSVVNTYAELERAAGLSRTRPTGKLATGKLPTPPSIIQSIKQSAPFSKFNQFKKELGIGAKTADALKKTGKFISGARKFLRFQEGGENQQDQMQQIFQFVAMELQRGTSKSEIIEKLISATQGSIDETAANQLIDQVANQIMGGGQDQMQQGAPQEEYAPMPDEQMMGQEEYAYGGGYSGTYDAGSGSYFQMGGSFVPTYGDILPEYMYGAMMQEGGTYGVGDTLDVSPEEMEYLRQQGYDFDVI